MWFSDRSVAPRPPPGVKQGPGMTAATPCCHTQFTPVTCDRLFVQCASWTRRCALGASPRYSSQSDTPPSFHLRLHLRRRRNRTARGRRRRRSPATVTEATPFPNNPPKPQPRRRPASRSDPSPVARLPRSSARSPARPVAPCRAVPCRRSAPGRTLGPPPPLSRRTVSSLDAG